MGCVPKSTGAKFEVYPPVYRTIILRLTNKLSRSNGGLGYPNGVSDVATTKELSRICEIVNKCCGWYRVIWRGEKRVRCVVDMHAVATEYPCIQIIFLGSQSRTPNQYRTLGHCHCTEHQERAILPIQLPLTTSFSGVILRDIGKAITTRAFEQGHTVSHCNFTEYCKH